MALTDGLVAYWKFNESSGDATDSTGNDNTLTNNNSAVYVPGKISNAIDLEASSSQFMSISNGDQTGLDLSTDFSFNFWVNPESTQGTSGFRGIISKWSLDQLAYNCMTYNDGGTLKLYLDWKGPGESTETLFECTPGFSNSNWSMVTVVADISVPSVEFYIDGSPVTSTGLQTDATSINNTAAPFNIGFSTNDAGSYWDGIIDEVGVWTRMLNSGEVTELYNGGDGNTYPFSTTINPTGMFHVF